MKFELLYNSFMTSDGYLMSPRNENSKPIMIAQGCSHSMVMNAVKIHIITLNETYNKLSAWFSAYEDNKILFRLTVGICCYFQEAK